LHLEGWRKQGSPHYLVMAGLDPAIHVLATERKGVDAPVLKRGPRWRPAQARHTKGTRRCLGWGTNECCWQKVPADPCRWNLEGQSSRTQGVLNLVLLFEISRPSEFPFWSLTLSPVSKLPRATREEQQLDASFAVLDSTDRPLRGSAILVGGAIARSGCRG